LKRCADVNASALFTSEGAVAKAAKAAQPAGGVTGDGARYGAWASSASTPSSSAAAAKVGTGSAVESLPLPEEYTQDLAKAGKPTGMPKFSDSAKTGFEAALQRQYGQPKDDAGNGGKGQANPNRKGRAKPGKLGMPRSNGPDYSVVTRNLALELVRVTEAAALGSAQWMGLGDKRAADQAAVDAMRLVLNTLSMDGRIVIGEGEKDEAPMLYNGEFMGDGSWPAVDIAVDPLDGTSLIAQGRHGAISVIALAERGAMFEPQQAFYMEKLCVPFEAADAVDINAPVGQNIKAVADALGKDPCDISVAVLDRPRHSELIYNIRRAGARVHLIADGDVAAALAAATPDNDVDMLMGIGGSPEGVIAAAAMRCIGGGFQVRHAVTLHCFGLYCLESRYCPRMNE